MYLGQVTLYLLPKHTQAMLPYVRSKHAGIYRLSSLGKYTTCQIETCTLMHGVSDRPASHALYNKRAPPPLMSWANVDQMEIAPKKSTLPTRNTTAWPALCPAYMQHSRAWLLADIITLCCFGMQQNICHLPLSVIYGEDRHSTVTYPAG